MLDSGSATKRCAGSAIAHKFITRQARVPFTVISQLGQAAEGSRLPQGQIRPGRELRQKVMSGGSAQQNPEPQKKPGDNTLGMTGGHPVATPGADCAA